MMPDSDFMGDGPMAAVKESQTPEQRPEPCYQDDVANGRAAPGDTHAGMLLEIREADHNGS